MEKELAKAEKELLVKHGLHLSRIKELGEFLEGVQEFLQYLGTNQYYSDIVNKKIFLLTLDVDALLLRMGRLTLFASSFRERKLEEILRKSKNLISAPETEIFRKDLDELEKSVYAISDRALTLTEDIREDYKRKEHMA